MLWCGSEYLSFESDLGVVLTVLKRRHIRAIIRHWITGVPPATPYRRRFAVFQSNWICRVNSTRHLSCDISHGHAIYRVRTGTTASPQRFMPFNKLLVTEKCRATQNVRSESTSRNALALQRRRRTSDVRRPNSRIAVLRGKTLTSLHFLSKGHVLGESEGEASEFFQIDATKNRKKFHKCNRLIIQIVWDFGAHSSACILNDRSRLRIPSGILSHDGRRRVHPFLQTCIVPASIRGADALVLEKSLLPPFRSPSSYLAFDVVIVDKYRA